MHLSSILDIFNSICAVFSTTLAAPAKDAHHTYRPASDAVADKRQLQIIVDIAVPITAAKTVVDGIEDTTNLIDGDIAEAEGKFRTDTVEYLRDQYPNINGLVYHDQDSGYDLFDATHTHVEMDNGLGFTKEYDVWVFDHGTFELAGDGGYQNWAIGGDFSGPRDDVTYYSMNGC